MLLFGGMGAKITHIPLLLQFHYTVKANFRSSDFFTFARYKFLLLKKQRQGYNLAVIFGADLRENITFGACKYLCGVAVACRAFELYKLDGLA